MALMDLIASGAASALTLLRSFTAKPLVGIVPIECYRFEKSIDADVAKQVLIDLTQGKVNVLDNVAPGPRTWEIEGYIGGLTGELSALFMPSIVLMETILDLMATARQIVTLRDKLYRSYQVLIARYWAADIPDTQNRMNVKLTLVQVTTLSAEIGTDDPTVQVEGLAGPSPGTLLGIPLNAGSVDNILANWALPQLPTPYVLRGP